MRNYVVIWMFKHRNLVLYHGVQVIMNVSLPQGL